MSYGFEVRAPNDEVTFELTTRLTKLLLSRVVGANSSGSVTLDVPAGMQVVAQAIPTYADSNMRHVGHSVSYNNVSHVVSWSPAFGGRDLVDGVAAWAVPVRVSSRVLVFAYMPEV